MSTVEELWQQAVAQHQAGQVVEAAELYRQILAIDDQHHAAMNYLGAALAEMGDVAGGLGFLAQSVGVAPHAGNYWFNYGSLLESTGKLDDAAECFEKARTLDPSMLEATVRLAKLENNRKAYMRTCALLKPLLPGHPDHLGVLDTLVVAYHQLGEGTESARLARHSLVVRDRLATGGNSSIKLLPRSSPEAPSAQTRDRNVISLALWGDADRYVAGAIENIRRAASHMPYWRVRIYCDESVPGNAVENMMRLDAQIIRRRSAPPFSEALFWRFDPVEDGGLDRVCVRDADSRIGAKEAAAVVEWVSSGRPFHIMRDHPCNNELILAGMWGAVCGMLDGFSQASTRYRLPTINRWNRPAFSAKRSVARNKARGANS